MSQYSERVGRNINKYRSERQMTLREVGELVGISEATMQKYEKGKIKHVDIDMLSKIANALNVRPEKLTEWESKEAYADYRASRTSKKDTDFFYKYKQLTKAQKESVQVLVDGFIELNHNNSKTTQPQNEV